MLPRWKPDEYVQPVAQPSWRALFHVREKLEKQLLMNPTKRERHITPTINEVMNDLNVAQIFSKLDVNKGYNQSELAPESK